MRPHRLERVWVVVSKLVLVVWRSSGSAGAPSTLRHLVAAAVMLLGTVSGFAATRADARTVQPVQRCQIAKLGAAAAELRARLLCDRGRGSALEETPCDDAAAARRAAAVTRAERGAICPVLNEAAQIGLDVGSSARAIRFSTVLSDDAAAKRCATRQLTAAARAAWDLSRAAVAHGRSGDDARFLAAVARLHATFDAVYARLARSADCASADTVAAAELFARVRGAVDRLRGVTCPSCGAACPCWSTRELDASLPPGTLDALGGAVCDENGTGVVSADRCTDPESGREQPRAGVNVAGGLCVRWQQDADSARDGRCGASPLVERVDSFAQENCTAALRASRLRQASCAPDAGPRRLDPMPAPSRGEFLLGVGGREWIAVQGPADVVLPWDAAASAGPLPVPGCPLGADGTCRVPIATAAVGDSDWRVGRRAVGSSGGSVEFFALGPQGEVLALPTRGGDALRFVRVGPGPLFFGDVERDGRVLPVVWAAPDAAYRELPVAGFAPAPSPRQSDAEQRLVGDAEEARLPVLWTRSGDGYRLETLPLLDGDATGSAVGIDAGVVAGISGSRAVAWELGGDRVRVVELPRPRDAVRCSGAVATSRGRVLGVCESLGGRMVGVLWARSADAPDGWRDVNVLSPFVGDDGARVDGLAGDVAIGRSVFFVQSGGLATSAIWRLPSVAP